MRIIHLVIRLPLFFFFIFSKKMAHKSNLLKNQLNYSTLCMLDVFDSLKTTSLWQSFVQDLFYTNHALWF